MGTRIPARWKLLLPSCLLLVVFALPIVAADARVDAVQRAGAPEADGDLDDDYWADVEEQTLTFDGTLAKESTRAVRLLLAHNGTHLFVAATLDPPGGVHDGDYFLMTLYDGDDDAIPTGRGDLLRYGYPTTVSDRFWDGEAWSADAENGCARHGEAARASADGTWHYEFGKPLSGDDCDIDATADGPLRVRFEFRENQAAPDTGHGDDMRWPTGSAYLDVGGNRNGRLDEVQGWGTLRLLASGETAAPPTDTPTGTDDPTGDDGTTDPNDGADEGGDGADGDATDGQDTPAPAFALLLTVMLALVAQFRAARRT